MRGNLSESSACSKNNSSLERVDSWAPEGRNNNQRLHAAFNQAIVFIRVSPFFVTDLFLFFFLFIYFFIPGKLCSVNVKLAIVFTHCQKFGSKWRTRVRIESLMAAKSCKEMCGISTKIQNTTTTSHNIP